MTTAMHKRSVHIDAPVDRVFDYVKDPHHFYQAFSPEFSAHSAVAAVNTTPEGVGSTVTLMGRVFLLFHMEWTVTREEYVPNERIVDHAWLGRIISTFEPGDPKGTTLSLAWEWFTDLPVVRDMIDRLSWNGDKELDTVLANLKKAIEA